MDATVTAVVAAVVVCVDTAFIVTTVIVNATTYVSYSITVEI